MVQMMENWARIGGYVRGLDDLGGSLGDWVDVLIEIDRCEDDAQHRNFLRGMVGETAPVRLPVADLVRLGLHDGDEVELRARKATPLDIFGDGRSLRRRNEDLGPEPC